MPTDLPTSPSSTEVNALADQLAAEMRQRWEAGDRVATEDFLTAHPDLNDHPGAVGELIYEEVSLRREFGEAGSSSAVLRRFPQWGTQLRVMLDLRDALDAEGRTDFPQVGERLGDFHLIAELGRGSRGRVFLARQMSLADRPVVVKLTPCVDAEHLSLARLQHTNIVPLYAAHEDSDYRLRILCMPFFGGVTLAQTLSQIKATPPADQTPTAFWAAIASAPRADPFGREPIIPARWAAGDCTRLIAHFGVCLADALQFAHERNLVHMDVKPSNILLTADGQPMLLDFHLAMPPLAADVAPPDWLGGTATYCAPELRAAMAAVQSARPIPVPVDGRADVYSLGVVLYEALAGRLPENGVPASVHNRRVSAGLSDIVARCLAMNPTDRYPDAAALADDLRRHLAELPLRGTRNRSLTERWRKWRRRRPHALGLVGVLALVLLAFAVAVGLFGHRRELARTAIDEGNAELEHGRIAEARGAFRRGLAVAADLPLVDDLTTKLTDGLKRADRVATADDLHAVAEGMRALSMADIIPPADRERANQLGHQLWDRRVDLFALVSADLPTAIRERARADVFDVILVWSHLRAERDAAFDVLSETETALGPCAGLYLERAALARDLGRPGDAEADLQRAATMPPASAWDHVIVGLHHLRRNEHEPARIEFEQAVALDPRSLWARLALGRCAIAQGLTDDALLSFAVCVGLDPHNPVGHLFLGHVHARLGQRGKALAEFDRTLGDRPQQFASSQSARHFWQPTDRRKNSQIHNSQKIRACFGIGPRFNRWRSFAALCHH